MSIHIDVVNIYVSSPEILAEIRALVRNTPIKVHTLDQIEKEESKFTEANIEKRFDQIIAESEATQIDEKIIESKYNPDNIPERKRGRPRKDIVKDSDIELEEKKKRRELHDHIYSARRCKQCQKEFMPKNIKQQFCSNECYRLSIKEIYK